eukprot:scaffold12580_cov31-Tisochrysis_lutea.AAC.1
MHRGHPRQQILLGLRFGSAPPTLVDLLGFALWQYASYVRRSSCSRCAFGQCASHVRRSSRGRCALRQVCTS